MQGRTLFKGERFMYQLHTKKTYAGLITAAVLVGSLAMTSAQAAKAKVDVCHVPVETPEDYKLKSVSGNGGAVAEHLLHSDWLVTPPICEDAIADNNCDGIADDPDALNYDCVVLTGNADATCDANVCVEPDLSPFVFARAFIDVNQNQTYESDADIEISSLEDTNESGQLDVGDTLTSGQYPLSFDPCPAMQCNPLRLGKFTRGPLVVNHVDRFRPGHIWVYLDGGSSSATYAAEFENSVTDSGLINMFFRSHNGPDLCITDLGKVGTNHTPSAHIRIYKEACDMTLLPDSAAAQESFNYAEEGPLNPQTSYFLEIEFYDIQP
jgi:hypothetical protein